MPVDVASEQARSAPRKSRSGFADDDRNAPARLGEYAARCADGGVNWPFHTSPTRRRGRIRRFTFPRSRVLMLRVSNGGSGIRKNSDDFERACHRNSSEFRYENANVQHQNSRVGLVFVLHTIGKGHTRGTSVAESKIHLRRTPITLVSCPSSSFAWPAASCSLPRPPERRPWRSRCISCPCVRPHLRPPA